MTEARILIAPATFKGTISAYNAAVIIASVLRNKVSATLDFCPIADGGDDTLSVLSEARPSFKRVSRVVTGPVPGERVSAFFLVDAEQKIAVVEAAQAHGLVRLPKGNLAPLEATSFGVGELIRAALEECPVLDTLVVTVGGSASTDGGAGALQALGFRFLNREAQAMAEPLGGGDLRRIRGVLTPEMNSLGKTRLVIATDVTNPLLGPTGAAAVYGPQKGATPEQVAMLEEGLSNLNAVLNKLNVEDKAATPGTGAAGGLAFGLSQLPGAEIRSGIDWIARLLNLPEKIAQSHLIITGEGRLDGSSLSGKGTGALLQWVESRPVLFLCGQVEPGLSLPPNVRVQPFVHEGRTAEEAMKNPEKVLRWEMEAMLPWIREHCLQNVD